MKIAILMSGYIRTIKENYDNFQKYLLNGYDTDVYIHITKSEDPRYINTKVSLEELYTLLNPKIMIVSKNYNLHNDNDTNNILNQNYKYYVLNEERKKIEKIENIAYDIVIKIRPDIYLQQHIEFDIDPTKIYIPSDSKIDHAKLNSQQDNYICDIIAYGHPEIMNQYFNFYESLLALVNKYSKINETLLYHYLHEQSISYELIDLKYIVILSLCNTIAITGDSGSGKTTVSNIIKKIFTNSFILECDRYHKWERNDERWKSITHLNPEANYITKMTEDVFDLKLGKDIYQVDYNHTTGKFTDKELIESTENVIVCGLHSLYIPDNIMNLKIYIDTDDNLRIPWKIKRDTEKRGYTIEKIITQINNRRQDFNHYIYPQREKSDIIIHYYTDTIFDINNFDINKQVPIYMRIGIKNTYDINQLITKLNINKVTTEKSYIFLHFMLLNTCNLEEIITAIILDISNIH